MPIVQNFRLPMALSALFAVTQVDAATVIQPDVKVLLSYLENGGLTGSPETQAFGVELNALLSMSVVNELHEFMIVPKVRVTEYDDKDQPDREEFGLQVGWRRIFETAVSDLRLGWARQDLLRSELREPSPDFDPEFEDGVEDSGIVDVESSRDRLHFDWDLEKQLNQRNQLVLFVDHVDLDFDQTAGSFRVDFTETRLDTGWRWQSSELSDITFTVGGSRFESDNNLDVDAVRGFVEYYRSVSELFDFYIGAGYEESDQKLNGQDLGSSVGNVVYRVGGQRTLQRTRFRAGFVQTIRPNSTGNVNKELGGTFDIERDLTEKLKFRVAVSAFTTEDLDDSESLTTRDFLSGRVGLAWRLDRKWSVELDYVHSRQDFDSVSVLGGETETRNSAYLGIRYQGLRPIPRTKRRRL